MLIDSIRFIMNSSTLSLDLFY